MNKVSILRLHFLACSDVLSWAIFAKSGVTAHDVIAILALRPEEINKENGESIFIDPTPHQEICFEGAFKDTIKEMNEENFALFIAFCTGCNYVPHENPGTAREFLIEV